VSFAQISGYILCCRVKNRNSYGKTYGQRDGRTDKQANVLMHQNGRITNRTYISMY